MPRTPPPLGLSHPPPRRPLRPLIAKRDQLAVCHIRPDPAARTVDQLIDLLREHHLHRRPLALHRRHPARQFPLPNPIRDRLVIATHQRRCLTQRPRQVIRLQDLHHFLRLLHARLRAASRQQDTTRVPGAQDRTGGEIRGRQWGELAAARGEFRWPPMGRISWPPTDVSRHVGWQIRFQECEERTKVSARIDPGTVKTEKWPATVSRIAVGVGGYPEGKDAIVLAAAVARATQAQLMLVAVHPWRRMPGWSLRPTSLFRARWSVWCDGSIETCLSWVRAGTAPMAGCGSASARASCCVTSNVRSPSRRAECTAGRFRN